MKRLYATLKTHRRLILALLVFSLFHGVMVWANMSTTSSTRFKITDTIIELYELTNNVYVPAISLAAVFFGAANLLFGFMRFGPIVGRIIGVIGIVGLGVTWFGQTIGANVAIALVV